MFENLRLKKRFIEAIATGIGSASLVLAIGNPASAALVYGSSVVATGLLGPRGMAFSPDGDLYVAETGTGGGADTTTCITAGSGQQVCYGATGAIGRYNPLTGNYTRVITDLPSLATATGTEGTGINDVYFDGSGNFYGVLGLGANPNVRGTGVLADFGKIISIDLAGTPSWAIVPGADIAGYEAIANPDGGEIDSNPYSIVVSGGTAVISDAGGNSLVLRNGSLVNAPYVFPETPVTIPFPPFNVSMEAVPTGIAIGSDNALYIAQLTGFPFPPGGATIFRASGGSVTPFATGFTNLIDIAAGPNSDLYALEYATNLLAGNLQGTVWHIAPDGTKTKIFSEGLIAPTGIAVARNGTIYVTNSGAVAGQGQLLAIAPVPEPDSLWGLVSIGAVAVGIRGLSRGRK